MTSFTKILAAAVACAAVLPAAASASTVDGDAALTATYTSRGRAADLAMPLSATPVLTDAGARLTATGTCTSVDAHSATCPAANVVAVLGGADDTAKLAAQGRVTVDGGAGEDGIFAWGIGVTVGGGGGRDLLIGSADGTATIDGGGGSDRIYARGAGTAVTGDAGQDLVVIQSTQPGVDGGEGADSIVMTGSTPAGTIAGGAGADLISAWPSTERFASGGASYDGRAGSDIINVFGDGIGVDHVTCGTGTDTVYADADDDVAADCETVLRAAPPAGSAIAGLPAQGAAFKSAVGTLDPTTLTPGPLLPGF